MRKRYKILLTVFTILAIWLVFLSMQEYEYPDRTDMQLKVNYLSRIIKEPFDKQQDIINIQNQNPEWALFSLSFSTFALTNISFIDITFRSQAIETIDSAIQKAMTYAIYKRYFNGVNPCQPEIDTTGSILYFGHLNMMLGCYRLLSHDTKYNELNDKLSESIYNRFRKSGFYALPSYPGRMWVPDNTAGLASLKLHSENTGSQYQKVCDEWVYYARKNLTDKETGLLYSTIQIGTGKPLEEPRGCMIGWSIFFIYRFNKDYANELYEKYKDKFSDNLLIFRLFNERYKNSETTSGDIDSGPLFWGYGIPATAFAFGDAVALQDLKNAKKLQRLIEIGSKRIINNNELKYETRYIDLQVSPLAESLLLYFETMTEWKSVKKQTKNL